MPDGSLLISVLREGSGFVPGPETVLEPGDEILAVLDPGSEEDLKDTSAPTASGGLSLGREVEFLLVGGGMAGANCAAELRKAGAEGSMLVGREPEPPYERPPLSKEYMRGEASARTPTSTRRVVRGERGRALAGRNVMSLDPEARTAKLQGGDEVPSARR